LNGNFSLNSRALIRTKDIVKFKEDKKKFCKRHDLFRKIYQVGLIQFCGTLLGKQSYTFLCLLATLAAHGGPTIQIQSVDDRFTKGAGEIVQGANVFARLYGNFGW
jgi:hypothetical protein